MEVKRRLIAEEEEESAGWITSFGDLMSLLLTFFILIVSFSTVELIKFRKAMGALRGASGALSEETGNTVKQMLNSKTVTRALPQEELQDAMETIESMVFNLDLGQDINVDLTPEGIRFRIASPVMFASGEATLQPKVFGLMNEIGKVIRHTGSDVRVEGHTDNVPISSGIFASNWELSSVRAVSVVRYLVEKTGVDPTKIIAVGRGEFHPIASNDIPEERALNRRVEVYLEWPDYTGKSLLEKRVGF